MQRSSEGDVVLREYPLWIWLPGLVTIAVTSMLPLDFWERVLFQLVGVALVACPSVLTIGVQRRQQTLTLHYRSLIAHSTRMYRFDEIVFIRVAEDREGERMYRVELALRSGRVVPLQYGYSAGRARKERRAQRLREALGVGGEASATRVALSSGIEKSEFD